jgi:hypothetical protein
MATSLNVGRMDRILRVALGFGFEVAAIFVSGHRYLGWGLGVVGASLILSCACGT